MLIPARDRHFPWPRFGAALLSAAALAPPPLAIASDRQPGADLRSIEPLAQVDIIGTRERLQTIAGSGDLISAEQLARSRAFTANEALRKAPGVTTRDEEGFGLRPNIGIRGLNPTRSTKVTLLEDGIPLAYSPYGDNASYYHPPIDRFERIEVLKGANSIAFGPQTIGGVINYVTPTPPEQFEGFIEAAGGSRDYFNGHARVGGGGWLGDFVRKQGDGSRDNLEHQIDDANLKFARALGDRHALQLRLNAYREKSTVTYSGLTEAEFGRLGARYNPFDDDKFDTERRGASLSHRWTFTDSVQMTTNVYYATFDRDWWRQSSTTTDGQCGAAFTALRLAGSVVDPATCNSVQGRLRSYESYGVEPRLSVALPTGELQVGVKWHQEEQDRKQVNGTSPTARTGILAEDNLRDTDAQSAYAAWRFDVGAWSFTPLVRHERIGADRLNRLAGQAGSTRFSKTMPGLGISWRATDAWTAFAGLHQGFSPPRVEDLIGGTGTVTDVDPEESTNIEVGLRGSFANGISFQAAAFRNDFDNLIAVGSIAAGNTPLSQGEALFQGLELSGQVALENGFYSQVALTWLDRADQSTAFRNIANQAVVGVAGNRQPYAPERTATVTAGYAAGPLSIQVEGQYVSEQLSDFANTVAPTPDGQRGVIASHTLVALTAKYALNDRWNGFVAVKNLTDRTYIVDRTRGIQVGQPRLVQAGVRISF